MQIVLSGSSGLIGKVLTAQLPRYRHTITRLLRFGPASGTEASAEPGAKVAAWDPEAGLLDPGALAGQDAVICLNGVNIAEKKWDRKFKAALIESRVKPTALLAGTLASLPAEQRPPLMISCSAIGWYGSQPPEKVLTEDMPSGTGYLAEICRQWEAATAAAEAAGVRVVHMRMGIVLAPEGGPLELIVQAFKKGLGAVLGNGHQMMSWVCINDVAPAVNHLLQTESLSGPVNIVAPHPVSNAEMTKQVASVLGKHLGPAAPAFALRLLMGEMADELMLASQNVSSRKLTESGFSFQFTQLEPTLKALLQGR